MLIARPDAALAAASSLTMIFSSNGHLGRPAHLVVLVSLPRQHDDVLGTRDVERPRDRRTPILDPLVVLTLHAAFDVVENCLRVFGARIVARDDHDVRLRLGNGAHLRSLAAVAIAAAAEDDDQTARARTAARASSARSSASGV